MSTINFIILMVWYFGFLMGLHISILPSLQSKVVFYLTKNGFIDNYFTFFAKLFIATIFWPVTLLIILLYKIF